MKIGDTIAQQANIPPFKNFSQKIIFGVRINEIINETNLNKDNVLTLPNTRTYRVENGNELKCKCEKYAYDFLDYMRGQALRQHNSTADGRRGGCACGALPMLRQAERKHPGKR